MSIPDRKKFTFLPSNVPEVVQRALANVKTAYPKITHLMATSSDQLLFLSEEGVSLDRSAWQQLVDPAMATAVMAACLPRPFVCSIEQAPSDLAELLRLMDNHGQNDPLQLLPRQHHAARRLLKTLQQIHTTLDGAVFCPESFDAIVNLLHKAGLEVRSPEDMVD